MSVVKGSLLDKGMGERSAYPTTSSSQASSSSSTAFPTVFFPSASSSSTTTSAPITPATETATTTASSSTATSSAGTFAQPAPVSSQQQQQQQQNPMPFTQRIPRQASAPLGGEPPTKRNRPKALTLEMGSGATSNGQLGLLAEAALNSPSDTLPGTLVSIGNRHCRVPPLKRHSTHVRVALFVALAQQQKKKDEADAHETIEHNPAYLARPAVKRLASPFKAPTGGMDIKQMRSPRSAFRPNSGARRMRSASIDYRTILGGSLNTPLGRSMSLPIPTSPLPIGSPFLIPGALPPYYAASPLGQAATPMSLDPQSLAAAAAAAVAGNGSQAASADGEAKYQSSPSASSAANALLTVASQQVANGATGAGAGASGGPVGRMGSMPAMLPGFSPSPFSPFMGQEGFFFPTPGAQITSTFPPGASPRFPPPNGHGAVPGAFPPQRSYSSPSTTGAGGRTPKGDDEDGEGGRVSRRRSSVDAQWPEEWLEMPCVQFNRLMKTCSLSAEQIAELKKARRRKKNRAYAKRSRDKKNAKIEETMARYQALEESVRRRVAEGTLGMAEGDATIAEYKSIMEQQKRAFSATNSNNSEDDSGSEGDDA